MSKIKNDIIDFLKKLLVDNFGYKVAALFFAAILWSFVLSDPNTERDKTLKNVAVSLENESRLLSEKNLVIRGDKNDILKPVKIIARVKTGNFELLKSDNVYATVDLSRVNAPGKQMVKINASLPVQARVISIEPSHLEIDVNQVSSRDVPIEVNILDDLPSGYWRSEPVISPKTVKITGAVSDVEAVTKAVCDLSLADNISSFDKSIALTLYDDNGQKVDSTLFKGSLPAVTVEMDIFPKKQVPLEIEAALKGKNNIMSGYEVKFIKAQPENVLIAGDEKLISEINSLYIESVDLNKAQDSVIALCKIIVPAGVKLIDVDSVEVYVEISEIQSKRIFADVPISVIGLDKDEAVSLVIEATSVSLTGGKSKVDSILRSDVKAVVDVTGLSAGSTYSLPISIILSEKYSSITSEAIPSMISVTISSK